MPGRWRNARIAVAARNAPDKVVTALRQPRGTGVEPASTTPRGDLAEVAVRVYARQTLLSGNDKPLV